MEYTDRIYVVGASGPRLVARSDNTYLNVQPVSLAPDGTVVFSARLRGAAPPDNPNADPRTTATGTALLEWKNGQIHKLMDDSPRYVRRNATAAGSGGRIVYLGTQPAVVNGARSEQDSLFTGPDVEKDRLLGPGDLLFGAKVTRLSNFVPRLNTKGQFVFMAYLDNNKAVVVRANPAGTAKPDAQAKPKN